MLALALIAALVGVDDGEAKLDAETLAVLKKKLAGRVSVDKKTGLLQLAYDFRSTRQGGDFPIKAKPADVANNALLLRPNTAASHVVAWRSVQIDCQVQVARMSGYMLTAERAKTSLTLGGSHEDTLYLRLPKHSRSVIVPQNDRSGVKTIRFELDANSVLVSFDQHSLSERTELPRPGRIEFNGGSYGFVFNAVAFRGRPDPEWLKEFLDDK